MTLEQQVRRWQLIALTAVALLIGYIAGQVTPAASAQPVTKVQLDLSNCVYQWVVDSVASMASCALT